MSEQEQKPAMRNFIPAWYYRSVQIELLLTLAEADGASPEELEQLRTALIGPREPELVSLDEIYGKEEE